VLAAPTGRAAKRMAEVTRWPAGTLHRVLQLRPGGQAGHGPDTPLPADLVVMDEVSVLDALLANQLVKSAAPCTSTGTGAGSALAVTKDGRGRAVHSGRRSWTCTRCR
jgi:ATP-dependent exoDNAse (exonuclease V) alpha subunit